MNTDQRYELKHRPDGTDRDNTEGDPEVSRGPDRTAPNIRFTYNIPELMRHDEDAEIWKLYIKEAEAADDKMIAKWNQSLDTLLLFTALFSAVVTAFLVTSISLLQPDNTQSMLNVLITISNQLNPETASSSQPSQSPPSFSATMLVVSINTLWSLSLFISLFVSVTAMLTRQWLQSYREGLARRPLDRTRQRQARYTALLDWRVPLIIDSLPLAIHTSVFLFLAGFAEMMAMSSAFLAGVLSILLILSAGLYVYVGVLPLRNDQCPYRSPLTAHINSAAKTSRRLFLYLKQRLMWIWPGKTDHSISLFHRPSQTAEQQTDRKSDERIDAEACQWLMSSCPDEETTGNVLSVLSAWQPRGIGPDFSAYIDAAILKMGESTARTFEKQGTSGRIDLLIPAQLERYQTMAIFLSQIPEAKRRKINMLAFWRSVEQLQNTPGIPLQITLLAYALDLCRRPYFYMTNGSSPSRDELWKQLYRALQDDANATPLFECCLLLHSARIHIPTRCDFFPAGSLRDRLEDLLIGLVEKQIDLPSTFLASVLFFWSTASPASWLLGSGRETRALWQCDIEEHLLAFLESGPALSCADPFRRIYAILLHIKKRPSLFQELTNQKRLVEVVCRWIIDYGLDEHTQWRYPYGASQIRLRELALGLLINSRFVAQFTSASTTQSLMAVLRAVDFSSHDGSAHLLRLQNMETDKVADILRVLCGELSVRANIPPLAFTTSILLCRKAVQRLKSDAAGDDVGTSARRKKLSHLEGDVCETICCSGWFAAMTKHGGLKSVFEEGDIWVISQLGQTLQDLRQLCPTHMKKSSLVEAFQESWVDFGHARDCLHPNLLYTEGVVHGLARQQVMYCGIIDSPERGGTMYAANRP